MRHPIGRIPRNPYLSSSPSGFERQVRDDNVHESSSGSAVFPWKPPSRLLSLGVSTFQGFRFDLLIDRPSWIWRIRRLVRLIILGEMDIGLRDSEGCRTPRSSSWSSGGTATANEAGDFECNICFELAQDPVVTLCGHLYCWPCLYRWLRHHSQCYECPVCKVLIQEEKLVPLYGRGKSAADPRSKSYPGIDIPNRPSGQRPETAAPPPPPEANPFANYGFGFMGGFMPMATARFGNFTLSTAFGGLIPALFNLQFHGFQDTTVYGTTLGYPYGFNAFHGGHAHGFPQPQTRGQQADNMLKNLFILIGIFVVLTLICW